MRKLYIDLLRLIALFYMFFQHSVLGLLKPEDNTGIIYFLFEIVPFCPALFLFLAGFSMTFKFEKQDNPLIDNNYLFHLIKRGFLLIVCSQLFFFFEHGFQLPDFFVASGILNTIGLMIIISGLLLKFKYKKIIFSILVILLLVSTTLMGVFQIYIVPFNYGYEPISLIIIYGFIGVLFGLILISQKNPFDKRNFVLFLSTIGLFIMIFYTIKFGFGKVFFSDIGRYEIVRHFHQNMLPQNILFNSKDVSLYIARIWNFNFHSMVASLGTVFLLFGIGYLLEPFFQKVLKNNIFLPGKYAFVNYFYHLIVIALFVVIFDFGIFSKWQFVIFIVLLFVFSYLISFVIDRKLFRKKNKLMPSK